MEAREVIAEIERQIAWLKGTGHRPAWVALGERQWTVLERAVAAPSCEAGSAPPGYAELQVHGLPVHRSDSPNDVHVAAVR
ncbi:MAG: hypothetical protein NVSMB2_16530 [Chloroflexota bacterium]